MESVTKLENCTGCKMCGDLCPVGAISYKENEKGFWAPFIDKDKCIECGLCQVKCPINQGIGLNKKNTPHVFAAWSQDENVRITSTSGGVFWEFAKSFIEGGGIVVGCAYNNDFKGAKHIIVRSLDDLYKIKGSKYFQSDTAGIYKNVKKELELGKKVLFCGTPCQNHALSSFLGKEYNSLYYMDFICRSVNSPLAFRKFLEELEQKNKSKVCCVQLKNKDQGWKSLATKVTFANGEVYWADKESDVWVKGFIYNDLYTRGACTKCQYKVLPRCVADVTIGDFWGISCVDRTDIFKGVSVIMVNSHKGEELLDKIRSRIHIEEKDISDVLKENPALLENVSISFKQERFWKRLNNGDTFSKAVHFATKEKFLDRIRKCVMRIKKVLDILVFGDISLSKFIKYNYLCKNIERHNGRKILPHYGTIINFSEGSKIILDGSNLEIGFNKLRGSRTETLIRLDKNSVWECMGGGLLFYDTVVEIKENAVLKTGFFSANCGSVIIADKLITLGEDVMIGRNVLIYDSDFHTLIDENGNSTNPPKEVKIGDHVWLTSNITVLKGVTIGAGSLVTAQTVVNKNMPEHSIVAANATGKVIKENVRWNRERCINR